MDILNTFEKMLADENIEVREFAARAQEIKAYWDQGEISKEEYQELVDDLLELKSVNRELLSLDVQHKLDTFATYLKNIKFFASLM